jgi:hypothetical protein
VVTIFTLPFARQAQSMRLERASSGYASNAQHTDLIDPNFASD